MHEILEFATRHWLMVGALVLAFIWALVEEAQRQVGGSAALSPQEVVQKMNHDDAVILDIRENTAFAAGHITSAVNIVKSQIDKDINKLEKCRDKPLIIVCGMGRSSTQVLNNLRKKGFDDLYLLAGGMDAWLKANMPVVKGNK